MWALDNIVAPPRTIVGVCGGGTYGGNTPIFVGFAEEFAAGDIRVVLCTQFIAMQQDHPRFNVTAEGVKKKWPRKSLGC